MNGHCYFNKDGNGQKPLKPNLKQLQAGEQPRFGNSLVPLVQKKNDNSTVVSNESKDPSVDASKVPIPDKIDGQKIPDALLGNQPVANVPNIAEKKVDDVVANPVPVSDKSNQPSKPN